MSAFFAKLLAFPKCLSVGCRFASSTSSRSGCGSTSRLCKEGNKHMDPKKLFEKPKISGAPVQPRVKPPPPPPPKVSVDNSKYQANELFQYNRMSFYDIERSLSRFRSQVPSSIKKR
ncbi:uncharacterized protein LOC143301469 [Babylonia areolata]|uniref:uncharacterized protein LOC143301469 n=1 Tax=Babylonia areolata TaxID=304850 RepID=UPI003FD42DF2